MGREGQKPVLELNGGVGKGKSDYVWEIIGSKL